MTSVSAIKVSAPDFVQTQIESDPICSSAGCTQYKHKKKPLGYKINYGVPDFGVDTDIVDNHFAPKLDGDIVTTNKNLADTETTLGHHWALAVQLDSDVGQGSDPICSSAGCTQYKHKKKPLGYKINYGVPNFGVDTDMIDNHASLAIAEAMKSHKLALGTDA